ncbi:MAG: AmmeMemoRadiSam system protein A [Bacillota bacterium]
MRTGSIVIGGIVPHPPIMVPEVGRGDAGEVRRTQEALRELGGMINRSGAATMIFISPHGPVLWDAVGVVATKELHGNLGRFGAPGVSFDLRTDTVLVDVLRQELLQIGVPGVEAGEGQGYRLDHGVTAPLYWLREGGVKLPVVVCGTALLALHRLYGFGVAVQQAALKSGRKVAVIASGDLSHRLSPEAPNGYDPYGEVFDRRMQEIIGAADVRALMKLDPVLVERAGECGYRPIIMLFGALEGLKVKPAVLSYEGPFGVGYMVAGLVPEGEDENRRIYEDLLKEAEARRAKEGFLVRLARKAIRAYLEEGERVQAETVPPEFSGQAGVFVSLKKGTFLRGCIGTISPTRSNIVEEVIENAIGASTRDPRFDPVRASEIEDLSISVDVLGRPEPVSGLDELDPKRYGVIVSRRLRKGLLLPDLEGVDTPDRQVAVARQKAGIGPDEPVKLERFEVKRYF